jgi:RNA polymerase sigma-70 factor (ECF subfamily)
LRRSDLADAVIQETYLKIWNNAGTFDPKVATPITWMVAIARNRALDLIRKKTEASIEDEPAAMDAAGEEPNPLARREMTEELRRLLACLGQLEEDRRRMVLLAYYSGWSREQLAAKFDAPANTIKTRGAAEEVREPRIMTMDEEKEGFAAEYALGTRCRRARAGRRAPAARPEFTAEVHAGSASSAS